MRRVCTVCIANNTRARPGARARQRTLIHIETHTHIQTHTHTDPGGGSGSARQREPPRKRETRRLVQLCGGRCAPAPTPRSQPVSVGPGYLCGGRVRQLRLPPAPPSRARPDSRQQLSGLARGCVVCGLLPRRRGCHLPGRCPASPVAVSFFTLTLARGTSAPHAVPATSMPGRASTLLCSALLPGRRQQSFTPVAELGAAGRV